MCRRPNVTNVFETLLISIVIGAICFRFKLKEPNASFLISSIAKINLIPKHVWEPILAGMAGKPENADSYQEKQPIGSGPYKVVRFKLNEEIVLERNGDHFAAPKMDRFILRIVPNNEASLGMLRRGELNFQERLAVEREYVENYSIRKDVKILLRTVSTIWRAPGAY